MDIPTTLTLTSSQSLQHHGLTSSHTSLIHLNIRSLRKHFEDLLNFLSTFKSTFSIVALSETWLTTSNECFPMQGYNVEFYHRPNVLQDTNITSSHGGVALYIAQNVSYIVRNDLVINSLLCESLFVEITSLILPHESLPYKNKNIIIGVIYRSPSNDVLDFSDALNSILVKLKNDNLNVILLGDINIDCASHASAAQDYLDILADHGLNQWITPVTRYGNSGGTVIDHIMTNIYSPNFTCGTISTGITDHESIFLFCHITVNSLNNITTYEYVNYAGLKNTINNETWEKLHNNMDINKTYKTFIETIKDGIKKHTTTRRSSHLHKRSPWITKGLLTSIAKKQSL